MLRNILMITRYIYRLLIVSYNVDHVFSYARVTCSNIFLLSTHDTLDISFGVDRDKR